MKTTSFIVTASTCLLFFGGLLSSCQQNAAEQPKPTLSQYELNFVPAKTSSELKALQKDQHAHIIRTEADLDAILAARISPLSKLSQLEQKRFREGIVFREGVGVVGLEYVTLQQRLTYSEFAEVLAHFGLDVKQGYWGFSQDPIIIAKLAGVAAPQGVVASNSTAIDNEAVFEDHKGYACETRGTCIKEDISICLSGC